MTEDNVSTNLSAARTSSQYTEYLKLYITTTKFNELHQLQGTIKRRKTRHNKNFPKNLGVKSTDKLDEIAEQV